MIIDTLSLIRHLERNRDTIATLLKGLEPETAAWKPDPESWSILEVTCHLADEEHFDFRARLDCTLNHPGRPWPPIDPVGWVGEKDYAGQKFETALWRFCEEREKSVAWLKRLEDPDWDLAYEHPKAGPIRAGDLALSWIAHDLLHLRQFDRLLYQRLVAEGKPYSAGYAGDW